MPAAVVDAPAEAKSPRAPSTCAGDTLSAIARRHGTTVEQLKAWNNLRAPP